MVFLQFIQNGLRRRAVQIQHRQRRTARRFARHAQVADVGFRFGEQRPEVAGARMMGGGFGGCTINIVASGQVEAFSQFVETAYEERYDKTPDIYVTQIEDGTRVAG